MSGAVRVVVGLVVCALLYVAPPAIPRADALAPVVFAIGNRVWLDTNNNGKIDVGEIGIDGVEVALYDAANLAAPVATTTTANGGYYLFPVLPAGNYVVAVRATNFSGVLKGYWSSGTSRTNAGALTETAAPGPNTDVDSDDNGMLQTSGLLSGAVASGTITLGPASGTEPTGETDLDGGNQGGGADADANMTVDFGF